MPYMLRADAYHTCCFYKPTFTRQLGRRSAAAFLQARLHAVNLANELFTRSSLFRALIARSFTAFLEYSLGYKAARPLPPPQQDAVQLRERALECIERWVEQYGTAHPQVLDPAWPTFSQRSDLANACLLQGSSNGMRQNHQARNVVCLID